MLKIQKKLYDNFMLPSLRLSTQSESYFSAMYPIYWQYNVSPSFVMFVTRAQNRLLSVKHICLCVSKC
jgi:hypothetical protein